MSSIPDKEVLAFVDSSSLNRTQSINEVSIENRKSHLLKELEDAYTELADDPKYRAEIELWDVTVGDGLA